VAEHLETPVEEMLEVVRQETLVVEMADTGSILGMLVAEHLETLVEKMLEVVQQETLVVEMADKVSILGMLVAKHLETLVEEMLLKEGSLLELVVVMVEKALEKLEVVRQKTLMVEMADTVSILGMLVAEHLETPVKEMLEVVR
jgi:hypothetical protein